MALNDTQIKKARPTEKLQKLSNGGGLQLHVAVGGGKLWRCAYRFDNKQKTISLGSYPAVSLAQARELRDGAKKRLAVGIDPMAQKKARRIAQLAASQHSFEIVARKWFDHWKSARSVRHADYVTQPYSVALSPSRKRCH